MPERKIKSVLKSLHFTESPVIVKEPPGPKSQEFLCKQREVESNAVAYPRLTPLAIKEAKGATIKDVDGNIYLDFFGGAGVLNVGHLNPTVLKAVNTQLKKLIHSLDFPTQTRLNMGRKLLEIAPGTLKFGKVLFTGPTGSDAIEAAIKLAMFNTKRKTIFAFEGSYHGMTHGALSASSGREFYEEYLPLLPHTYFVPYAYCYRCTFGKEYPGCDLQCLKYTEHLLEDSHSGASIPAAIIVEPVQGEGGCIVPPMEFIPGLREIADRYSIPLIFDEIQAGNARCGKMFSSELTETTPDIMTIAKGFGGIGFPFGAVIYKKELDKWQPGAHIGTFRGHQVAMAAGLASIEFIEKYDLTSHSRKMGEIMLNMLKEEQTNLSFVGELRGKGLMVGIEFVKDKRSKAPFPEMAKRVQRICQNKGVIFELGGHFSNVVRCLAPLTVTEKMIKTGTSILINAIKEAEHTI